MNLGISDGKVTLDGTDINGNTINRMVFTDRFGMYMFGDLDAGTYKLTLPLQLTSCQPFKMQVMMMR
ncbi:MAG: hypothetical protein R2784_05840 [Saprospiraceae bacterium]